MLLVIGAGNGLFGGGGNFLAGAGYLFGGAGGLRDQSMEFLHEAIEGRAEVADLVIRLCGYLDR